MPTPRTIAYPSLIRGPFQGGNWTVAEVPAIQSAAAPADRILMIPRRLLAEDYLIHHHELSHIERAAVMPRSTWLDSSLRGSVRRSIEEPVIDAIDLARGIDTRSARDHLDWASLPVPGSLPGLVDRYIRLVMGVETGGARNPAIAEYLEAVADRLRQQAPDLLQLAYDAAHAVYADQSAANCDMWADRIAAHPGMKDADPRDVPPPSTDGTTCAHQSHGQPRDSVVGNGARRQAQADADQGDADAQQGRELAGHGDQYSETIRDQVEHGRITVHRHITTRMARAPISSGWYATEHGATVRFPRGLVPNGRIFGMRAKGGSILIDLSASMNWDTAELTRAVASLPGLWVAGYSAPQERNLSYCVDRYGRQKPPKPNTVMARVCILARDGRVGEYEKEHEHSYVNQDLQCDAPALEYAIKRAPAPLVWVSDGKTGDPKHTEICSRLMKRHHIVRVLDLTSAVNCLSGRAIHGYAVCDYDADTISMHR